MFVMVVPLFPLLTPRGPIFIGPSALDTSAWLHRHQVVRELHAVAVVCFVAMLLVGWLVSAFLPLSWILQFNLAGAYPANSTISSVDPGEAVNNTVSADVKFVHISLQSKTDS